MALSAINSPRNPSWTAERARRCRARALFHHRRDGDAQCPAAVRRPVGGGFALAHNGNLTNALRLREELIASGAICQSTSDTEVIMHLVARSRKIPLVERLIDALLQIEGGYALVASPTKS